MNSSYDIYDFDPAPLVDFPRSANPFHTLPTFHFASNELEEPTTPQQWRPLGKYEIEVHTTTSSVWLLPLKRLRLPYLALRSACAHVVPPSSWSEPAFLWRPRATMGGQYGWKRTSSSYGGFLRRLGFERAIKFVPFLPPFDQRSFWRDAKQSVSDRLN